MHPMPVEHMPARSLSMQMPRAGGGRFLVLSSVVLGPLLVAMLVVLLSPLHTLLPFGRTASTHTPTATPTPAERTLFSEPLTSTSDRNWPNDSQCSQAADGFHVKANVVCYLSRYTPPPDANISVDVKQVSGLADASYGVAFHRVSQGNFYTFEINGSGLWFFFKAQNGQIKLVAGQTMSRAIRKGLNATNTLAVRITGSHYAFLVNGQVVGTGNDSSFGSGLTGLEGNDQIELVYTNFKVTKTVS